MAELQVQDLRVSVQFNEALRQLGVAVPLRLHANEAGEIVDATGTKLLQVDPDGFLSDDHVHAIARLIVLAVNTCGGFRAVA